MSFLAGLLLGVILTFIVNTLNYAKALKKVCAKCVQGGFEEKVE